MCFIRIISHNPHLQDDSKITPISLQDDYKLYFVFVFINISRHLGIMIY